MTALASPTAAPRAGAGAKAGPNGRSKAGSKAGPRRVITAPPEWDAVTVLSSYGVTLFLIPATLIVSPLGASGTPATIMGVLMLVWWAVSRTQLELGHARGVQPVRWVLLIFAVSVLLSYTAMSTQFRLPVEVNGAHRGILSLMGWSGVALVVADGIRTRQRLERLLERVVLLAALMAAVGLIQFFIGFDIAAKIHIPGLRENGLLVSLGSRSVLRRVAGTASHPIEFGVVLAAILPLALHFAVGRGEAVKLRTPRSRQRDWICLGLIVLGAFLSVSRSATLGIIVVIAVVFSGWPTRWRIQGLMWVPLVLAAMRVAVPGLVGTIFALFESFNQDPSVSGRTDDYNEVAHRFAEAPWLGRGFNTFLPPLYRILDNQYLVQLVTTGLAGVFALISLFVVGWCCARGARWRTADFAKRNLAQAVAASLASLLLTFGTFDALAFPMVASLTFFLLGCSGALWRLAREDQAAGEPIFPGRVRRAPTPGQRRGERILSGVRARRAGARPSRQG